MRLVVRWVVAVTLVLLSASSWAQLNYFTLIDSDNDTATGCSVTLPASGTVVGIERRLTAAVSETATPQVTQLTLESCVGGSFGAPVSLPGTPYPVGLNNSVGGADAVEQAVAANAVAAPGTTVRLYFAAQGPTSDDLIATVNGDAQGAPILFALTGATPVDIPTLTQWSLLGLALFLAGLASWRLKRYGHYLGALLLVVLAGIVLAVTLDGQVTDWAGKNPIATDPQGDSTDPKTDLTAAFADVTNGVLSFRIDVANAEGNLPAITSANTATFAVGSAGSFTVTTSGSPTPTLSRGGVALPNGVTFTDNGNGTGTLSGTPIAGTGGSYALTFTATNANGTSSVQNFTLNVNQAPAITNGNVASFTIGTANTFTITTTGFPTVTSITLTGCTLPAGLTFNYTSGAMATISGTATVAGTVNCTITASNGVTSNAIQALTVTIAQNLPVASNDSYSTLANTTLTVPAGSGPPAGLLVNDALGTPSATLAAFGGGDLGGAVTDHAPGSSATLAGGTLTVNADGSFTLATPTTPGTYTFQYRLSNSAGTSDGTVAIQVQQLPVASNDSYTTPPGVTLTVPAGSGPPAGLLVNDTLGTPSATLAAFGGGDLGGAVTDHAPGSSATLAGGTLTVNSDGSFTLATPAAGTYTFQYRLSNSAGSSNGTVTLTVNQAPAASNDSYSTLANTTLTVPAGSGPPAGLLVNDALGTPSATLAAFGGGDLGGAVTDHAPGSSATLAGGTLTVNADGSFTLATPTTPGTYTFQYRLSNSAGTSDGTVAIQVQQLPVASNDSYTTPPGVTLTVPAGSGPPAGLLVNDTLGTPSATLAAFGGGDLGGAVTDHAPGSSATLAGGTLTVNSDGSFTLATPAAGTYTFQYRLSNSAGSSNGTVTLTVNQAPAASNDSYSTLANTTLTVPAGSGPPAGLLVNDALGTPSATLAAFGGGDLGGAVTDHAPGSSATLAGGTLTVNADGSFTLATPTTPGTYTFQYRLSNSAGTSDGTVAIQVQQLPVASNDSYTTPPGVTLTVPAGSGPPAGLLVNDTLGTPSATLAAFGGGDLGGAVTDHAPGSSATLAGGTLTVNSDGSFTLATPAAGTYTFQYRLSNSAGSSNGTVTLTVNQAPTITSTNTATFAVGSAGSFTVTTSGSPTPTLSRGGVALPNGVTFTDNGDGTGTLSGTPAAGTSGGYALTFTATNGVLPNATQNFTLTVQQPPSLSGTPSSPTTVGLPYSFNFTVGGSPTPTLSVTAGALPTGIGLTGNTLAGTPTVVSNFTGITVTATNGVSPPASVNFGISVVCPTITVNPTTLADGLYNSAYSSVTFAQSGSTGSTFTWSATGLPTGLTINATSGQLSGTPTQTGSFATTITVTDNFGCTGSRTIPPFAIKPDAVNDTYQPTVIGNVSIDSSLIPYSVGSNDHFPGGTTISTFNSTSAQGGNVTMTTSGANIGQFTYNPPAGYEGSDSFTYTLSSNGQTATATVNLTVSGMIWFINNSAAACATRASGCGRLTNPYSTLAAFQAENNGGASGLNPSTNDNILIYESGADYTGSVILLTGQKLIGQDATASLATITGLTPGSGSATLPVMNSSNGTITKLTNTVTLNTNTTVRGFSINSTTNTGVNDPAAAITGVSVSEVNVATTTGTAVLLNSVDQSNLTFKSISANGAANGISLTNVNMTSGSFTVTGDGATPGSGGTIRNTVGADSTTNGIGVYLSNAQNVSLNWMQINDHSNFAIRGDNVTNFAMNRTIVSGANGTNAAATPREASVLFDGLFGTSSITDSTISGGIEDNLRVENTTATPLTSLTVSGTGGTSSTCQILNNNTTSGNIGFRLAGFNNANMTVTVTNCLFRGNRTDTINIDAANTATVTSTVTNNTILAGTGGNNRGNLGINVTSGATGSHSYTVNNNFVGTDGTIPASLLNTGINLFSGNGSTLGSPSVGFVQSNTVRNADPDPGPTNLSGHGIQIFQDLTSTLRTNVNANTVSNVGLDFGIRVEGAGDPGGAGGSIQAGVTNNNASVRSTALDSIRVRSRRQIALCSEIRANTTNAGGTDGGFVGLFTNQSNTSTFTVEGLAPGAQTAATAQTYLISQNPAATTLSSTAATNYTGVAANTCAIP